MLITTHYFDKERVVKLELNGPNFNLLSSQLLYEFTHKLDEIASLFPKYRAIIITGSSPKAFSAGASIDEFNNDGFLDHYKEAARTFYSVLPAYPIPIIAAVDGYCFGGGFELLLSCDLILVSKQLKLGFPELTLGVIPGFGGTQRLTHIIGKYKSMELILTTKRISGSELFDLGIANHLYDSHDILQDEAFKIALNIGSHYPQAVRSAKLSINHSIAGLEDGSKFEAESFAKLFDQDDKVKAVDSFLHKEKKSSKL